MKAISCIAYFAISAIFLCFLAIPVKSQTIYFVSVDTSPLKGQKGYLDFQFNPSGADSLNASMSITSFATNGVFASTSSNTGDVIGLLPGPVIIRNTSDYNDLFQGIVFDDAITFIATFSGVALSPNQPFPSSGSGLAISLYDADGVNPLLTNSLDGSLLHINIDQYGETSVKQFADISGVFRGSATNLSAVPESSTRIFAIIGLGCLIIMFAMKWIFRR